MDSPYSIYRDFKIFNENLGHLPVMPRVVINTINQYSFCVAEEDKDFRNALMSSDVLLPDGIAIVVALKLTTGQELNKISGSDLHKHLLKKLNDRGGSCFYLGSSENTLLKIQKRLALEYPNIDCGYFSPPFRKVFTDEENEEMINKVNAFNPDVLFVGMTAPRQEKWVHTHKDKINANYICSVGAVFDYYAETVKRPSKFWIDLGLEWFIRLCKEPKRLWKRYLYYGPIFVSILLKERLKSDFSSNNKVLTKFQKSE